MESKLQIFVSSTFTDLKDERQAAVEAILKSGHIPAGMELFTAGDKSQWDIIQRWITNSDIYMLILGGRYGSIEPDTGTSYIELEYDFAVSCGKPHFAVVINNDSLKSKVKTHGTSVIESDNPKRLEEFRTKVLSKMSSFFSDNKDIKIAVLETIPQLMLEYEIKGWVRATEMLDAKALADELSSLHTENKALRETLLSTNRKFEQIMSAAKGDGNYELFELLSSTMIDMRSSRQVFENSDSIPDSVSVSDLFRLVRNSLMSGVENKLGMSDLEKFIFFTLCPKLQTHDLVENQKVSGAKYRRYAVTKKGTDFLAYVDKMMYDSKKSNSLKTTKKDLQKTTRLRAAKTLSK